MASILEILPVSSLKTGAMELWEKGQNACNIWVLFPQTSV